MAGGEQVACTRDDVARLAGVSPATVSRACNRPGTVSKEKLRRIRAAAKELGYVPDRNASSLRRKGSGAVLLVLPAPSMDDVSENRVYRWSYGEALINAQAAVERTNYQFRLALWSRKESLKAFLSRNPCDGVVFGLGCVDERTLSFARRNETPCMLCSQGESHPGFNLCWIDEMGGGAAAAKAMRESGRSRLAHVTGSLSSNRACQERWAGFEAGAGAKPLLIDGELGVKGGYESGLKLLPLIKKGGVDGVFVVNDLTAVGVMHALLEGGAKIPKDVAMLGYDNLPIIHTLPVRLASVDESIGRLYGIAVSKLLQMMRGEGAPEPVRVPVEPCFVPGDSLP